MEISRQNPRVRKAMKYSEFKASYDWENFLKSNPDIPAITVLFCRMCKMSVAKVILFNIDFYKGYGIVTQNLLTFKLTRCNDNSKMQFLGEDNNSGAVYFWPSTQEKVDELKSTIRSETAKVTKRTYQLNNQDKLGAIERYTTSERNILYYISSRIKDYVKPTMRKLLVETPEMQSIRTNCYLELISSDIITNLGSNPFQDHLSEKMKDMLKIINSNAKEILDKYISEGIFDHAYELPKFGEETFYSSDEDSSDVENIPRALREIPRSDSDEIASDSSGGESSYEVHYSEPYPGVNCPKIPGDVFFD
ncbi:hypothetical protein [Carp edema virus]|nr:hypothetical protein [Carp edema virus]